MPDSLDTVNKRIANAAAKFASRSALSTKVGKEWKTDTYGEIATLVRNMSLGLRSLGVERGDRVALLSENRPEWAVTDLASLAAGAVTVPVYSTLPPAQVRHILADSGARAVLVSDAKQFAKVESCRQACPNLSIVISIDEVNANDGLLPSSEAHREDRNPLREGVRSMKSVLEEGRTNGGSLSESYEARRDSVAPGDLMSLVYTSGTTGNPKGAMLTHANFVAALDGVAQALPLNMPNEVFLSFLPLCHIFERVVYCLALTSGAQTYYNDSIFKLVDNLAEVRPTILQCVPRVFESIHERIGDAIAKQPETERELVFRAIGLGDEVAALKNAGKPVPPGMLMMHAVADKTVLAKIRSRFGGRLHFAVSGGAPLSAKTAEFFNAIGIPIIEGWGLTETTAASAINPVGRAKVGTVGTARFGAEVTTAEDGELLVRGATVMQGYWNEPEATAAVIDPDGWFHTGDIGEIDTEGYIKITDRKKDILVLPNGKKVAPQPIETMLKHNPYIAELVLVHDHTGSVSALVVPNFDRLKQWAREQGKEDVSAAALIADPAARKFIKSQIDASSADLAEYERIKRVALLERPLSVDEGELTPTLKVRRKVVTEKYAKLLERD